jgi:hypothetical protein
METELQAPRHSAMAAEHAHAHAVHAEDDHGKFAWDDIDVRSIALVVGVGAVLIFVAIVAVQVIYYRYSQNEYVQKVEQVPTTEVNNVLAEQRERLATGGEGAEQGEQRVPIEDAIKAVLADYQQRQNADRQQQDAGESASESESAAAGDGATEETATRQ